MISKNIFEALMVCALVSICGPAVAARGFEYSYADVGYNRVNGDNFDVNSAQVDASFGIFDHLALRAGYLRGQADDFPKIQDSSGDPDVNEFRFGVRPHYSVSKSLDLYADLIYFNAKFNGNRTNTDIGGIYAAGLRYQAFKKLEIDVGGQYRSGDTDSAFFVLSPVIQLSRNFDLVLRAEQGSDDASYFGGIRLNF